MTTTNNIVYRDPAVVRELTAEEALAMFRQLSDEEKCEVIAFMEGMGK